MGFVKYIDFDNLSEADKKAVQKLLQQHKKELQDAMRATDKDLAALKRRRAKKAKK